MSLKYENLDPGVLLEMVCESGEAVLKEDYDRVCAQRDKLEEGARSAVWLLSAEPLMAGNLLLARKALKDAIAACEEASDAD